MQAEDPGSGVSRRQFLAGAGAAALSLAMAVGGSSAPVRRRPNFVFILTDDHRADALSCVGHPIVHTPNIDRIAREGAIFRNAFTTTSLCSPSRASFLTGRYAHSHGVVDNARPLDPTVPTFPQALRGAGYDTAFIGKWHMSTQEDPQPGFDRWISFPGQGVYYDPVLNIDGERRQVAGYITDLLTQYAVDWLQRPRSRPFCLCLSHKAMHSDFYPAVRHSRLYERVRLEPPASIADDLRGKPQWLSNVKRLAPGTGDYDEFEEKYRNYYRCLAAVDEGVGRVLRSLERIGALDDTVVVFAGDNGFFMGEHGLTDKRAMYEESIRIPMVMRYPRLIRPRAEVWRSALNIDICPTFLDLAGLQAPDGVDGRSLVPLLRGDSSDWRSDFLYEYNHEAEAPRRPTIRGVRTERWKYITYPGSENTSELYDLKDDPAEMHNLIDDPRAQNVLRDMQMRLARLLVR